MKLMYSESIKKQRGISLVELMVAITLSLILGVALIQIFSSSRSAYRVQEATSRLQENGRYTLEAMAQDVRMAGYMGCASIDKIPVTIKASSPPSDVVFDSSNIVRGLDNVITGNTYNAQPGTDVLIIRRASDSGVRLDGNMTADNANISIVSNVPGFKEGDFLFITDCMSADLFRATNVSTGSVTIAHSASGNTDPKLSKPYGSDAEVLAFKSVAYFIRDTGRTTQNNQPILALYTQARGAGQGSGALVSYELVEGVQDLQLRFGRDTSGDGAADIYVTASDITTSAQWSSVVAVRLDLLMQSTDSSIVPTTGDAAQRLDFNGATIISDGRLRQSYSMVVAIRNRLQ